MTCTATNAKPVEAVFKSDGDETVWPGGSLVKIACDILNMLASRGRSVGVTPMCTVTSAGAMTTVRDLSALQHVLTIFEVAGKIGCLLAWIKFNFFQRALPRW